VRVKAERVAKKSDGVTLCRPSHGYAQSIEIDIDDYVEVPGVRQGDLPASDQSYPKGAPDTDLVKIGPNLLRRKTP
jgi:hypothetical protein